MLDGLGNAASLTSRIYARITAGLQLIDQLDLPYLKYKPPMSLYRPSY